MRQRAHVIAAATASVIGATAVAACDGGPESTFEDDATVTQRITSVRLDGRSGGVTLRGEKGRAKVDLHRAVRYRDDRPKGPTHRVEDGVLVLRGCGDDCSVDYTVRLPAGLPVSGRTTSGEIRLSDVGEVSVRTTSGSISLDGVAGPAKAHTTNGEVKGRGLRGGRVQAETSNGTIDLVPATAMDVRAKTSNGGIVLAVPPGRYRVSAKTDNGDREIGVANDPSGDHTLDLTTGNGEITVKKS